jgi:hypothetical protein
MSSPSLKINYNNFDQLRVGDIVKCVLPEGGLVFGQNYKIINKFEVHRVLDLIDFKGQKYKGWFSYRFSKEKIIKKII